MNTLILPLSSDSFNIPLISQRKDISICAICKKKEHNQCHLTGIIIQRTTQCTICHYWTCQDCFPKGGYYVIVPEKFLFFCNTCCKKRLVFQKMTDIFVVKLTTLRVLCNVNFQFLQVYYDSQDEICSKKRRRPDEETTE